MEIRVMPANKHDEIGDDNQIVSVRLLALNLKIKNNGTPMVRPNPPEDIYSLKVRPIKHRCNGKAVCWKILHKNTNIKRENR